MAAQRQVWDRERGSIVADLMHLAAERQKAVSAQQEDLGSRIAAARQLSAVRAHASPGPWGLVAES